MNASEIRARYPRPRVAFVHESDAPGQYCVGGALCQYLGYTDLHFPPRRVVAEALREANPSLGIRKSARFADLIVQANDALGDFEAAWKHLDTALAYKRGKRKGQPVSEGDLLCV